MNTLITGANGMIGSALLQAANMNCVAGVRQPSGKTTSPVMHIGDLSRVSDFSHLDLSDINAIVHTAGRAHVLTKQSESETDLFRLVNVSATLNLALRAADCGVKRFVFLSSIGVLGNTTLGSAFDEEVDPKPCTDYGHSKWEAEQGLFKIASETELEVVIVRPPMVVAAHAPGNLRRLMNITSKGIPLPLASVHNQRSLVALDNLVDFLAVCIDNPAAANQTFVISDNDDVSTPEIITYLAKGMGKRAILVPFPVGVLSVMAKALGKEPMFTQLCGSLRIDCSKARNLLGWKPKVSARDALMQAGSEFIQSSRA